MGQAVLESRETVDRLLHFRSGERLSLHHLKAIVETTVSEVFAVDIDRLQGGSRGQAQVAQARQVAMYLLHCAFSVSFTDIGHAFARDRTTVGHACKLVEDRRDDSTFDFMMNNLEEIVRHLAKISLGHSEI